ncbi:MAG: homoserine kinase [Opitutales bacterium]
MPESFPVTAQIPASTSNLGPGFDALGLAVSLYNFVGLRPVDGEDGTLQRASSRLPARTLKMAEAAARLFGEAIDRPVPAVAFDIWGEVPMARGLGSSATVRAGLLAGLNRLAGEPLDQEALIGLSSRLDNAPDNSAASIRGGFVVARADPRSGRYLWSERFTVGDHLSFVAVSPDILVHTTKARRVLPKRMPHKDATRSLNSLAALVAVFASGHYERLENVVTDFIHQPYREKLAPFTPEAIRAGREAGAYCGWLSGSGSTVMCVSKQERARAVGDAMQSVFKVNGMGNRLFRLEADNAGLQVIDRR